MWREQQSAFARAILDSQAALPVDALGLDASVDALRLSIYRNNISISLIDCLQARFPVVCALVGEEFFRAMARVFARIHPPRTPVLIDYGAGFAEFVAQFEPARSVVYLADVARLENAWSESYHAAEDRVMSLDVLSTESAAHLAQSTLQLHPSLRLIRSRYSIASLWAAHHQDSVDSSLEIEHPEDVLIVRPETEVSVHVLQPGALSFIESLLSKQTVESAAIAGKADNESFDVGIQLVTLVASGAVARILPP